MKSLAWGALTIAFSPIAFVVWVVAIPIYDAFDHTR
jgi:hypothetical protein